jgi:serpin B
MKYVIATILAAALLSGTIILADGRASQPFTAADAAASGNAFACDLYRELCGSEGNLFFSPSSIATALAMTYAGAAGGTAAEMAAVLHLPDDPPAVHTANAGLLAELAPDEGATHVLRVANRLWGQEGFELLPAFLATVRDHYGGGYAVVDFVGATEEARLTINDWVAGQTEDRIRDLLQPGVLGAQTSLVLTNAVYFHGLWQRAFAPEATEDAPFFTAAGREVETPFMRQTADFAHGAVDGLSVLRLPYEGEELSCWVLLPDARDGLAALESRLDTETLDGWLASATRRRVRVSLPRFEMTSQFELGRVLAGMGMPSAFGGGADFSGMTGFKDQNISEVVHKAFVDVYEEGTEAAAATAVVMKRTSAVVSEPPVEFRADHPFLFLIRHEGTGAVLFMGRLTDSC